MMPDNTTNNSLTPHTTQKTVLEQILDWSKKGSMWQRDALRRILQQNEIDETDIYELTQCLKTEKSSGVEALTMIPLEECDLPANPQLEESVSINKISNISHVNNLATNQELEFCDQGMTVIYGGNGSGKSGYTRILKNACRASDPVPLFGTLTNIEKEVFHESEKSLYEGVQI